MTKYNAKNERVKHKYFRWQTEAQGKAEGTIKMMAKALVRFEDYTGYKDFATFNKEQAVGFKKAFACPKDTRTGKPMSLSTVRQSLNSLKDFFKWLAWQTGYKSRIHVPDVEYFNLTDKEANIAKAVKHKDFPTLEQVHKVILSMPVETDIQRRDRQCWPLPF